VRLAALTVLVCLSAGPPLPAAESRFVAVWADGTRTADDEVREWHKVDSRPTLKGQPLFDAKNPASWLCDTQLTEVAAPRAFVEFAGGDRLPGRVVAYAESSATNGAIPHLLVAPTVEIDLPGKHREQIGVRLDMVRRIVWQASAGGRLPPGTIRLADGRRIAFRGLRWDAGGVQALGDDGRVQLAFGEIAELSLPVADQWVALYRMLALLSPDLSSRLLRLEALGGSRITTSLARLQPRAVRGAEPAHWYHLAQPAWSLEALCIPHRQIRLRTFADPREMPLSWFEPQSSRHQGAFSSGWSNWQADSNVQGGALRSGGQMFAWGFGTHAHHELEFDLPAPARAFRTRIGLDQVVAGGGCARGRIVGGDKTLFESPLLVGATQVVASGSLALESAASRRLLLVADAAMSGAPAGGDPLDVRDVVDWLEPVLVFDPHDLERAVEQAAPRALWGSGGWTVDPLAAGSWRVTNRFRGDDAAHPIFRPLLELSTPLNLTAHFQVAAGRDTALVNIGRPRGAPAATFEISVDGVRLAREEIPQLGESGDPRPVVVPLRQHVGREIELAIRFAPAGKRAVIDWRGIVVGEPAVGEPATNDRHR
jgi:hypothetical protein